MWEASGDADVLPQGPYFTLSATKLSCLIRNGWNLFFSFACRCVRRSSLPPETIRQISGATLRRASPAAAKGNCFLIKPRALIPMIFSRHKVAHAHSAKRWRWLRERAVRLGNLLGCEQDKKKTEIWGFASFFFCLWLFNKAGGRKVAQWLKQWVNFLAK